MAGRDDVPGHPRNLSKGPKMKIKAKTQIIEFDGEAKRMVVINEGKSDTVSDTFGARMIAEGRATEVKGKAAAEPAAEPAADGETTATGDEGAAPAA